MTDIVNEASVGAARVLGTVAGTNTITAGMSPALTAYSAGMLVVLTPANANTGAVTIAIDGLAALDIFNTRGLFLAAGDLQAGIPALLLLDSGADDFILINSMGNGTFTGTLTGMSGATTGTVTYQVGDGICTLYTGSIIIGTSNATTMTMTGIPASIRPNTRHIACDAHLYNNSLSNPTYLGRSDVSAAGVITFALYNSTTGFFDTGGFASSGTKGLHAGWTITYPLY